MKRKVIRKQPNSKMCLVCGLKNPLGLKAHFYELENKELVGIFEPIEEHQGYPGRLHGGIISAILDETIGRSILINYEEDVWFVTVEFNVRFKKPVPLDEEVKVRARLTKETSRIYEGTGEIILKNEEVAAEGYGKYMKLPIEKIADFDYEEQEWRVVSTEKDPEEIEI
jgi:acyl-coenzyme A thioesterase PaaI-like protein